MSRAIGRMLIALTGAVAPTSRKAWAEAMRAEFEVTDGESLGWALGCLGAAAGWRLQADGAFLLFGAAASAAGAQWLVPQLLWLLSTTLPEAAVARLFVLTAFVLQVCPAIILAVWRPDLRRAVAVVVTVAQSAQVILLLHRMSGAWFEPGWQYFNGDVAISIVALLGACWAGAAFGAWVGRYSRRRLSAT